MRLLTFLEYCAVVVGIIAMAAAKLFAIPKGFHLGLFLVGTGIALGGLESVVTRRMSFRTSSEAGEDYAGAPAALWGLMALLVGAAVIASAYLMDAGLWRTTVNYLTRRPGPVMAGLGLVVAGAGALLMFDRSGRRGVWRMLLVRIPKTIVGLVLVVAGLAGVALGVWEWFDPKDFDRIARGMWERFDLRAFDRFWKGMFGSRR
ncbi:MAG: hypothetical protein A3F74_09425 [Betaproteobacteria bacterium RIFCSPLOWO2_12_FULL_62_58]|nr:MAG: hypothetical protein A3F74_09425 [Betaproteobacteria bacterium RIFCSPLOWO2_12_FULL_62_58]